VDRYVPRLRVESYDFIMPSLQRQFLASAYSVDMTLEQAFPKPQGMDEYRLMVEAQRAAELQQRQDQVDERAAMERR
jgi:hypothetical protein